MSQPQLGASLDPERPAESVCAAMHGASGSSKSLTNLEFARGVPAGLVEDDQAVCAGRNGAADLFEVFAHRCRVGMRHDDGGAGVTVWTDGTEQIGVFITDLLAGADAYPSWPIGIRASSFGRPAFHPGTTPRSRFPMQVGSRSRTRGPESLFLKLAIASGSCLGCRGRALMWEKPSFLSSFQRHAP